MTQATEESRTGKYIVIARVNTKYEDCSVVPEDAIIPAIYFRAFGPDTKQKCEEWKAENCVESKE